MLLVFAAAPLLALLSLPQGSPQAPGVLVVAGVWWAVLLGIAWMAGWMAGVWERVEWRTEERQVHAQFAGYMLWFRHRRVVPFHCIRACSCEIVPLPEGFEIRCRMELSREGRPAGALTFSLGMRSPDPLADGRRTVLQMGRALGWSGYRVIRSDPRGEQVALHPAPQPTQEVQQIPGEGEAVPDPGTRLPRFQVEDLATRTRILRWQPGRKVHLRLEPAAPRTVWTVMALVVAIALGLPVAILLGLPESNRLRGLLLIPIVEAVVLVPLLLPLLYRRLRRSQEVLLDWPSRTVTVRNDQQRVRSPLDEIREVVVVGHRARSTESHGEDSVAVTLFWCELLLVLDRARTPLLETEAESGDPDRPYRVTVSMAVELADALGVPWRWEDYR